MALKLVRHMANRACPHDRLLPGLPALRVRHRMRILLGLHHDIGPNAGAPRVIYRLGKELASLGHHVEHFSFADLPAWVPEKGRALLFPFLFARHFRNHAHRFDVVDMSSGDGWLAYRRGRRRGPLTVTHSHGLEHLVVRAERADDVRHGRKASWRKSIYRYGYRLAEVGRSFRRADLSLVLNAGEADYLHADQAIPRERIQIARLAVEDAVLAAPLTPPDPDGDIVVAQIGSYIPRKGIRETAEAMRRLMPRHPRVKLLFLGTVAAEATVRADYPGAVQDRLSIVPRYGNGDLPTLLAGASIQLMPSLFEGFGIAKLEAMARGLVPIVSDDAGAREGIDHGVNGLIVPVGDPDALERAIERLILDRTLRQQLRHHAIETAQSTSWASVAAERVGHYQNAIARLSGNEVASTPRKRETSMAVMSSASSVESRDK
jgi:glycosyltransferase involved in cell wall biosynthesis